MCVCVCVCVHAHVQTLSTTSEQWLLHNARHLGNLFITNNYTYAASLREGGFPCYLIGVVCGLPNIVAISVVK